MSAILVVDDEEPIRVLVGSWLNQLGREAVPVATGRAAIQEIAIHSFDAVLLDLRLGDIDGMLMLSVIRERHSDLPVIIVTGYPSMESAIEAIRLGVVDYLVKPINCDTLARAIDRLDRRRECRGQRQHTGSVGDRSYGIQLHATNLRLSDDEHDCLIRLAGRLGTSVSAANRRLIQRAMREESHADPKELN